MAAGRETDEQLTEYEKQRLSRIRENEARLEALGLRSLAASPLLRSPSPGTAKGKQKKRSADEDEEYVPSDNGGGEEDDESSLESAQDEEVEGAGKSASRSHAKGKKKKLSKSTKSARTKETSSTVTGASESTPHKNNSKASVQDSAKNKKIKKLGKSRIQLTEDDVVAFFSFDEVGKGYITPWDLERMATINDFIWTDSEISKMIRCFDNDGDGKINLEDFRSIVSQCNMLQEHEK
ncbi:protein pxr1-like isoform X3 [Miscanthus floridulus]|uniref:protein pxr1-like isoform X3 n=1 Tax=Miscanthus floridulus TaxID=154761 RepID=UPI00345A9488